MDTAGGLGRMFFDERIHKVPSDQPSLEEQLADRLGFAVDADKLARLSEIDTPPPSVLAAPQVTGVGHKTILTLMDHYQVLYSTMEAQPLKELLLTSLPLKNKC